LRNHADGIAAVDLFVVPTIGFRFLFGLVILNHDRRRIVHIAATYHPTAEWIARQIVEAFPWESAPQYLLRDRDGAYGKVFRKRLFAMGIRDRPVAPRSPWQNGYVERVIGSIRRDLLDHVIVMGEAHLRRLLRAYADYYNTWRTHLGLDKDTPFGRPVHDRGNNTTMPKLRGLHHAYVWIQSLVGTPNSYCLKNLPASDLITSGLILMGSIKTSTRRLSALFGLLEIFAGLCLPNTIGVIQAF